MTELIYKQTNPDGTFVPAGDELHIRTKEPLTLTTTFAAALFQADGPDEDDWVGYEIYGYNNGSVLWCDGIGREAPDAHNPYVKQEDNTFVHKTGAITLTIAFGNAGQTASLTLQGTRDAQFDGTRHFVLKPAA